MKIIIRILASWMLISLGSAFADDVTDLINQALENYKSKKFADAAENLDYAAQMVRQKRGAELEKFLPAPLEGWIADDAKSDAIGAAMFGGMLSAEKNYNRDESSVSVKIMTDSPMLQGMMMVFSNPMLASADGGKLQTIKNQKAIVKFDPGDKRGKVTIVAANRFLVEINVEACDEKSMIDYAFAIDFDGLMKM